MDIKKLLKPNKIAIIGASERPGFGADACTTVMQYMSDDRYYFVNPTHDTVFDRICYPSYADLPEQVDLMVICTPQSTVYRMIEEGARHGARAAVVFASGYGETGAAGMENELALKSLCDQAGIPVMGPNCGGYINTVDNVYPFAFLSDHRERAGSVGFVSQSGQFVLSLMDHPAPRFSYAISAGNSRITQMEDYLEFLIDDPDTRVVALYLEGVNDPARFVSALRHAAEMHKPIVVLKVGRSEKGRRVAASHTGSMAGADRVYDALFQKFGVVRVNDLEELMALSHAISVLPRLPSGDRIAAVALSGGETGICADLWHLCGGVYPDFAPQTLSALDALLPPYAAPSNPLDMTATLSYDTEKLIAAYGAIMRDPSIDLIVSGYTLLEHIADPCIVYLCEALERLSHEPWYKPVVMVPFMENTRNAEFAERLRKAGVPVLPPPAYAFRIIRQLIDLGAYDPAEHDFRVQAASSCEKAGRFPYTESESKALLSGCIPCGDYAVAHSRDEAAAVYDRFGGAVALKVDSRDILHKTDAGCVFLNLDCRTAVTDAYDRILRNARCYAPNARIFGVQICKMQKRGTEMILGVKRDPQFGMCVLCGLGGILVDVFHDTALTLAPITKIEAEEMLRSLKSYCLLTGYRGEPPLDTDAFADALVSLAQFAVDRQDDLEELDINPVFLYRDGLCAVDALYIGRREVALC